MLAVVAVLLCLIGTIPYGLFDSRFTTFIELLGLTIFPLFFLLAVFLLMEIGHYRRWKDEMRKRYGKRFKEESYDFRPIFKRKKEKRGFLVYRGSWGALYEKGISASFMFRNHKSYWWEFKRFEEIEGIYPWRFSPTRKRNKKVDGVQIETRDLKVCIFCSRYHPLNKIIPFLVSSFGDRWEDIYKRDDVLLGNDIGVHHYMGECNESLCRG